MQLAESPTKDVTLTVATPAQLPGFNPSIIAKLDPSTFILTNQSSRSIVGLAVRWTFVDAVGQQGMHTHKSDSFERQRSNVVVPPRGRLLVAPGVFLLESLAQSPHTGPSLDALDGRAAPQVATASQVRVQVDTIIFEDGEIVGPNQSRYDVEIQSRKIAADQLAKQVRNAQFRGEEPTLVLRKISQTAPSRDDFVSVWTYRYAQKLLKTSSFESQLAVLEGVPEPPTFFSLAR